MMKSVETICSKSCLEVRLTLDTEADRMHLKQQRQTGFDSHATANWSFLQVKQHLNVLYLMPILEEDPNYFNFGLAVSQSF